MHAHFFYLAVRSAVEHLYSHTLGFESSGVFDNFKLTRLKKTELEYTYAFQIARCKSLLLARYKEEPHDSYVFVPFGTALPLS